MSRRFKTSVQHWLDLERSKDRDLDAEHALLAVFRFVPLATPSAAFLGRVVADVRRSKDLFSQRWLRAVIAASLTLLTLAVGMLPVSLIVLAKALGLAAIVDMASRGLLLLSGGIVRGLSVWSGLAELSDAAVILAATPVGIWALAIVTLLLGVSVLLFREFLFRSPEMSS